MINRCFLFALTCVSIALITAPVFINFPIILSFNASASAPIGFYQIKAASGLKRGVYTLLLTPPGFRLMAAKRHYLPFNVPLLKRVVGLSGDVICRHGQTIFINQKPIATALLKDQQGRAMPVWQGCFVLTEDQFFALMTAPNSFDGRYFGPLEKANIIGIAVPLFIWKARKVENIGDVQNNQNNKQKDGAERKAR